MELKATATLLLINFQIHKKNSQLINRSDGTSYNSSSRRRRRRNDPAALSPSGADDEVIKFSMTVVSV